MNELIYGVITGIIFGFLLQKGRVIRYDKQLGALRLLDMTIVKFMVSTILVAMVGVYLLKDMGLAKLSVKPTILGGNIIGGLIFGLGWALLGYCPGDPSVLSGKVDGIPLGYYGYARRSGCFCRTFSRVEQQGTQVGRLRQDHHTGGIRDKPLDRYCYRWYSESAHV